MGIYPECYTLRQTGFDYLKFLHHLFLRKKASFGLNLGMDRVR